MIIRDNKKIYIGIDPGIVSGFAVWSCEKRQFLTIEGLKIYEVFECLLELDTHNPVDLFNKQKTGIHVRIEDPNTWIPFRMSDPHKNAMQTQGAGAVKQTFKHILQYLEDKGIEHTKIKIQGVRKKVGAKEFRNQTKWAGLTNEHGRDAAWLVYDL
jgi:hypothetical protein